MTREEMGLAAEIRRALRDWDAQLDRADPDRTASLWGLHSEIRGILAALRAVPSEEEVVWKEAAEVVGDYSREIHGTVGQGAYKVLLHLMEAERRLTARAARSRP